jgi:seryl-tRNA synthetase
VHTLNGSALAVGRTIVAIMENGIYDATEAEYSIMGVLVDGR